MGREWTQRALLVDNVTGETQVVTMPAYAANAQEDEPTAEDMTGCAFWWTGGNFACDCNRAIVFYEERDVPYPEHFVMREDGDGVSCVQREDNTNVIGLLRLQVGPWLLVEYGEELDVPRLT